MATGLDVQEPVLDTLRREDENEMEQAINIILSKVPVVETVGASHIPIKPPEETHFEVEDLVKGNEGSASRIEGEKFLKSPSASEVYFEENNLAPDACQVTENAEKSTTEHGTDASPVGEAKVDAEESYGSEKGLVSALEAAATSEVGHDESIPVHEAGLSENKEDSESTIPEKEAAHTESSNVNPEDAKTCVPVDDTEKKSSVEDKSTTSSTSQDNHGEKLQRPTLDTNQETPENLSMIAPNEETEQNLSIELNGSQKKTDENLKEDDKPESTLTPEGKIKDEEATQNESLETNNETETLGQKCEEVIEKGVESSPVAASEAEDIKASTSDHDTKTSAPKTQIPAENPQEIEVDKSEKETTEEQVISKTTTRDAGHDETIPVDIAKTEDEEPSKSDSFNNKEDTESMILVKEPIMEKHLESLNAIPDDVKSCDLVQETETKSSIKEKLPTAAPQETSGDKIEQTSFGTNEVTLQDISTTAPNEETEQNSNFEVPFLTDASTTDNELAITEGTIKDEDQRETDLLENSNETESELLKREITEKPDESLQLVDEAEDTKVPTSDPNTKTSVHENRILTENPKEIEIDELDYKPEKETTEEQVITETTTGDASHDETTPVDKVKTEDEEPSKSDLIENMEDSENTILVKEPIIEKHLESLNATPDDIKPCDIVQDTETKSSIQEKLQPATSQEIKDDKIEEAASDTKEETPEDTSTNVSNEETEQKSIAEVPILTETSTTDNELAITEGKIKDEDRRETDLLEISNETESELLKQEVAEKPDESLQLADEAEDTKVPTSDHNTKTSAHENQILTENPKEIEVDELNYKPEKETTEEQVITETTAGDASHDETKPVDKVKTEDEEPSISYLIENKEDSENTILVEEPIMEKHLESLNASDDDIKTRDIAQDTETKNSIQEKLQPATSQDIKDDKIEQTTFDMKEETPEDISTNMSNEETEQKSIAEVPFLTEASTTDDELAITEGKVKDEDQREMDLLENSNETESELLEQELTENPDENPKEIEVHKLDYKPEKETTEEQVITETTIRDASHDELTQVGKVKTEDEEPNKSDLMENKKDSENTILVKEPIMEKHSESLNATPEDIKTRDLVQDTETKRSIQEKLPTATSQEIKDDKTEQTTFDTKEETPEDISTNVSNEETEQNSIVEVPLLTEVSTTDNELAITEGKIKDEDQRETDLLENGDEAERELLKQEVTEKPDESLQLAEEAEDTKVPTSDLNTKTSALENQILTENPKEIEVDKLNYKPEKETTEEQVVTETTRESDSHDDLRPVDKVKTEDEEPSKFDLTENKEDSENTILVEELIMEKHLESFNATPDDIKTSDIGQDTETKSSIQEKLPTATSQEIKSDKIEQTAFDMIEETPEDTSTNVSNEETEQKSIAEVPILTEASTTDNELAITEGKIKDEDQRETDLLEISNETESELLKQEVTEKHDESLQLADEAEDSKVPTSDHNTKIIALESQILTKNQQEIVADETESEPCDVVDTKKETLNVQDVSTIESNDDNEGNSEIKEEENEKPLMREESTRDAAGDESTYTHEDINTVEGQRRAEFLENPNNAESMSSIEDNTILKLVEPPQVDAEDIKTNVLDQDAETKGQILASEGKSTYGEPAVKYEVEAEEDDQKEDQLRDNEKGPESNVLLEAAQSEVPIESLKETLSGTVPHGFPDDKTERKTVDAITKDKEILDVQNVTKTASNENIEENSLFQIDGSPKQHEESLDKEHEIPSLIEAVEENSLIQTDGSPIRHEESLEKEHEIPSLIETIEDDSLPPANGSQIQCKEPSEEESEMTSIIKASAKKIHDGEPINFLEDSSEREDLRKGEFGDTKINSQEEEAQVETPAKSSNIAAEDIIASDSCQETETSSRDKGTLNEEETVCDRIEVETLDTGDKQTQTSEAKDVSPLVPDDDNGESSETGENDLQVKNEETFGRETEKPSVTEASPTDSSGDDPDNKCEDKIESEEQTGAESFEDKKDMESKLLKEEETLVRLVESPRVDIEDIKTHVSDGAETTGIVEASEEDADINTSKNEVKTEDNDNKEDEQSDNEKNLESGELLEAAQTEKPIESLQETLPSIIQRGFLDDSIKERTVDAVQEEEDVHNVTTTVPNEKIEEKKIEENSLIPMDGSEIRHAEYLEKEYEIPSVIEAPTKHANDDELIAHEDNIKNDDPRKDESQYEKDSEINFQEDNAQIETPVKSFEVAAKDTIASDIYQGPETTDSQEEQILNENEIVHEDTEVERLDAADTRKETPEALDVSTFALNDGNEEKLVIREDDTEMKNEENLGKESENPSSTEASPTDASGDESATKCEDKIEGKEKMRAEDTECTVLKEAESAVQPLESPQVDAEDIRTYVPDQGTETGGIVQVFEEVANDNPPEVKCTVKPEDRDQKEDELCDNEKIPDSTLLLEVAEMEKSFESLKETLPTSVPRGFLDEEMEKKIINATAKDEETREIQNVTTIVSNENIEDDSLLHVDGSQMQCKERSEEESERTPIGEALTKNVNDDGSINLHENSTEHEDLKDELAETKEDTKVTSPKEEAQVETAVNSLNIAAEDIIESYPCQETETMSSQEERIVNKEEIVHGQIKVETLDTADTKTKTPEAQDVSTIKLEDEAEGKEQTGTEMFIDKKDSQSKLLKEEQIMVKHVESPHVDTESIETYVSDEGAETTRLVEAFEADFDDDKSAVKYEVKTEHKDQEEDKLCDNEKNPESGVLPEAAQIEKPVESLQETLPITVPRKFLDDKTEESTMDEEKDKEIHYRESVAKTVSNEKIGDDSSIQEDGSQIQHEEYLEKEIEIPSVSLLVAAEDIVASDSYHGTETTSQEGKLLNENEIVNERTKVERLDTVDSDMKTPAALNFATILSSENTEENSLNREDGSEQEQEELLEKENKSPPSTETLTVEVNDEVPEIIHHDKIEDEKLEKVDKDEWDKHEEITLLNEAPAEKQNESSKKDLEDIKDIVSGANIMEVNLIEVQSPKDNQRKIVEDHMDDNIVDKDLQLREIADKHLDKVVMFENEKHTEIGFIKEEEPVKKLEEPDKKDLEEIKPFVSHEGTETTSAIEERDLAEISQESVDDLTEDKILAQAQKIQDVTPIKSDEHAEKNSSIQPDGSQIKHDELSEKECEMLSTAETSFLHSSSNEATTVDVENVENEHLNKVDKFEEEKHTEIATINDQAPVEEPQESSRRDIEEIKAFVSWEGTEPSPVEEQGLSAEIMGDMLEQKILDKVSTAQEFTKLSSDENGEDISLMLVDESRTKHEELLEKESEASPLSETSLQKSILNESTILHRDKTEDAIPNRVNKFDQSEKHAEISLIKEEAPLEKLNELSLRKDLEEIKAFDSSEDTETRSTGERNLTEISQQNDFTTVDTSQIKQEENLEGESETPPLPLLHSSDGNSAIVDTGKIEVQVQEKVDKFEGIESGEATLLNEEAPAEKLTESSKDLEGIKESITCDGTEITSFTEEQNLPALSQEIVDDQEKEKVLNVAGEASDFTTIIPDNNDMERNLLVELDGSQLKHEKHLEEEREMPSLLVLNISSEEPTVVQENKIMEHTEIILSNEEALENSSREETENIKASVLCEDTETSSIEEETLISNSREIVGNQVKEKIIDMAQNTPDLTTITSDENAEENSLIQLDGSQIKHEEPLEKESETLFMSVLDAKIEESTILQGRITDDQDPRKVDEYEHEKDAEATLLKEHTPAQKVTESTKDDLEDTEVSLSCEDKEITSSILEQSQKENQQEIVVDQTRENIIDAANKTQDFKQTILHENAEEDSFIQVDESGVKHETVRDQVQENVLDTTPKDQDFKPAISRENAEESSLIQEDEIQMEHEELEKESETPSLLIVDNNNEEPITINEDLTEDDKRKKIHDFECEKHDEITSAEEETQVAKVNESLNKDLEDIKTLVSGEYLETTSFEEKQILEENPRESLSDQQEEKILDITPEAQNLIKTVSNENDEKDSMIQDDGSQLVHEEIFEKQGETSSLSGALILNTTSEDSTVIHESKIENEETREVDIFECEKHADGKILDAAPETLESKIIVLDENTEEKSSNQVEKSQTKHEELLEKENETPSLPENSLLNTSYEDSTTINDDKIEDGDAEKVDKLECERPSEFPLTKEEEPLPKLNNPLKEDIEELKEFVSCLDPETTSSIEDRSLQINPQEVTGDQIVENTIDTTDEPQNFTTLVSDEITKENLSLDDDESQIKHEDLLENGSEKPSSSILKTSNEESSFICDSKTENEEIERDEKEERLNDFPEGPENIEVSVPSENLETTSPIEEQSLTETLTKDKILALVPEAPESKTIVSDKNIEENSFILEDGSQMKHGEHSEKEDEMPSLTETSILNTRNEEPTLFLGGKIQDEDQAKVNNSEREEHAENTEVSVENPNSSNLENIKAVVSCEDIEPTHSTEDTVDPIENVGGQEVEKAFGKALEAPDSTAVVPEDNPLIQVDGSQMKLEESFEKESEVPSSSETSLLNTNNEEMETIHKDKIEDEAHENVDEFENKKCSEINKLKEEPQVEESVHRDIKAYVSHQDTEPSAIQEQIQASNPQDILGNQSEDNVMDTGDSKEKITEPNLTLSNEKDVKDLLIQTDESEAKHEEILEKKLYLENISTVEANNESTTIHKDVIEEESGKILESAPLNGESSVYEPVESLKVVSKDVEASVSSQNADETSSNLNADPHEIIGDQTDDKIHTSGTREITLEALNLTTLDSDEKEVLDSIAPQDGLEIKDEKISTLADNKESIIVHEDTIEGEDLRKVETFESAEQTENTLLKEEAHDEPMDSLQVASEPIKASVSCQNRHPTSSFEEQILTTTPQIVGDQVEEKLTYTAKTWEETPEVSSSVLAFQEDEANRLGVDDINSVEINDGETVNKSNAAEIDEICSPEKLQAKEEELEIISKTEIDEEAGKDDTWIKLSDDESNKTSVEQKEIDFSSHAKDTSEITRHDVAKDIPEGNENSTAKNDFLEDEYSNDSTESTTPIVSDDVQQTDKGIKTQTVIDETEAASSALPITGVQCGIEKTETSLAPERDRDNLQSGDDMKELDEGSAAISNEGNFLEENLNENIKTEVTAGEKEAPAVQQDPVSEFVVQEIKEQPGKTVEAVPEEKGTKGEQGEIKSDGSIDLIINSSTMVADKVAPSDVHHSCTSDAEQSAVGQETQIVVQEQEQKPGRGEAVETVPEEKGINTEEEEIQEHDLNVFKENSRSVALDMVAPVNILQGSTTDAALRTTDEVTPEQHYFDEASLKEIEGGPASTTDKLTVLRADQIDNANFDGSLASNKIPVPQQHGDSSESSQTEGEKQTTSEPEKGEKRGDVETPKLMEMSESTEVDKPSLSEGLAQEPMKEVSEVAYHSTDKKEPTPKEEELQAERSAEVEHAEAKTDEEKDDEDESGEHQTSVLSSDAPVMVDAADREVKVKKSHNILSGVGSKVKHSISKVRKAITGKSSNPKSASPKSSEKIK